MSCCNTNGSTVTRAQPDAQRTPETFQPNVDILETPDHWVIAADVPGATREGLELVVEDGVLRIRAGVPQRQPANADYLVREYPVGDFERSFRVGEGIDAAGVNASLEDGVLTIRLPKAEFVKPRKIEIRPS